jgi:hypothetical protein
MTTMGMVAAISRMIDARERTDKRMITENATIAKAKSDGIQPMMREVSFSLFVRDFLGLGVMESSAVFSERSRGGSAT